MTKLGQHKKIVVMVGPVWLIEFKGLDLAGSCWPTTVHQF
jgi:hypothetical protein